MSIKTINKGTPFNKFYTVLGYLCLIGSIYFFFLSKEEYIITEEESEFSLYLSMGVFFLAFSILLSFTTNRIKINNTEKSIFFYTRVLFLNLGTKTSLNKFTYSSILSKRMKMSSSIMSGYTPLTDPQTQWGKSSDSSSKFMMHDVVLLNSNHRNKLLLNRFDTFEEAKKFGNMMSELTQKPLVKYNPKRISKTK
jgi:hypothetical protein